MENLDVVTKDELHTLMTDGIKLGTTGLLCLTLYYYLTALQFLQKDLHYHYIDMENLDVVNKDELHTIMSDGIKLGTVKHWFTMSNIVLLPYSTSVPPERPTLPLY